MSSKAAPLDAISPSFAVRILIAGGAGTASFRKIIRALHL
jgi:hypothetical protein